MTANADGDEAALGQQRRFRYVRDESASPSTPDVLRRRSEVTLWAKTGLIALQ
jgi:hypothetical protein